jgi:hypothetical protein
MFESSTESTKTMVHLKSSRSVYEKMVVWSGVETLLFDARRWLSVLHSPPVPAPAAHYNLRVGCRDADGASKAGGTDPGEHKGNGKGESKPKGGNKNMMTLNSYRFFSFISGILEVYL